MMTEIIIFLVNWYFKYESLSLSQLIFDSRSLESLK